MIFSAIVEETFYRVNTPKWAYAPTSGAGAALRGGRLNRPGIEALYLSREPETAIAEYQQTSKYLPPGTIVTYTVALGRVVDYSEGFGPAWSALWQEFNCDWRRLAFNENIEPPTWVLYDDVTQAAGQGVLFPSMARPGGMNLVVYHAMLTRADKLEAIDPAHDLPKNQKSWS